MFGANHPGMDEWSTDDDGDYDEEDEDGDYIGDYDEYPSNSKGGTPPSLRNSAHNASNQAGMTEDEKKQRVAKKRADKRKKQKERKLRDTIVTMDEVMTGKVRSEGAKASHEQTTLTSRYAIVACLHVSVVHFIGTSYIQEHFRSKA